LPTPFSSSDEASTRITGRTRTGTPQPSRLSRKLTLALLASTALVAVAASPAAALDSDWKAAPVSGDVTNSNNWVQGLPDGTGFFNVSTITALTNTGNATQFGGFNFEKGAPAHTLSNSNSLTFVNAGIVINGGSFTLTTTTFGNTTFRSGTASSATFNIAGILNFRNSSTAGTAAVTNVNGGHTDFSDSSLGGSATITNQGNGSGTIFHDTSNAQNATIFNQSSGAFTTFQDSANAGSATIPNQSSGTVITFKNSANAGSAIIHNAGGTVTFQDSSTAGSAAIDNAFGGVLIFKGTSSGGTAKLINDANTDITKPTSVIDLSQVSNANFTAGSIAGGGFLNLGATNLNVGGDNTSTTFSGTIRDLGLQLATGGTLTKVGTGTLTLTGSNSYSGGTNVFGGVVAVSSDANLGAITGGVNFSNGGILRFTNSADITLSSTRTLGVLGAGTIDIAGSGNVNYGGTIGPSGGSLTVTGTGGKNAFNFSGTSNASITIATTGTVSVNGASLNGALTNNGVFSGAASTIGGAVINAGLFNVLSNLTAGSTFTNSGTVQIVSGTLTATGRFANNPSGTVTVVGTLNASAGGIFNAGTITVIRATGGTVQGNVGGNGVVFDDLTNTGTVTNNGTFNGNVASNTGTITNAAGATWTGNVSTSGTFVNDGTISGSVTVSGGTFSGAGSLGVLNIASGATFTPGSGTPGTSITVNGNLVLASGATYAVTINPTAASFATVTGTGTLGGATVNAIFASGSYVAKQYTILTAAGGLGGTAFGTLTTSGLPAGFNATLGYTSTNVTLGLTAVLGQTMTTSTTPSLGGTLPVNQQHVATALNTYFNNGGALPTNFMPLFGLTGANLVNGLSQVSGEVATSSATAGFQDMGQFLELMLDPFLENRVSGNGAPFGAPSLAFAQGDGVAALPDAASAYARMPTKAPPPTTFDARWTAWGAAFGSSGSFDGNAAIGSHDLTARSGGFAGGIDYRVGPNTVIGFAASGSSLSYSLDGGLGSGSGDAFKAGLYASTRLDNAYLSASAAYGNYDLKTSRVVLLPGIGDHLTSDVTAHSFGGRIEAGYRVPVMATSGITPYAAFQAQSFHLPAYGETDATGLAAFALAYNGHTFDEERSELGARFDTRLAVGGNSILLLRGRLAWAHEFGSDPAITAGFETLPGTAFTVTGAALPRDALLVSAGPELKLANGWSLRAKFDGSFSGQSQTYAGTGTLRYTW
jgi:uncharacterized protein with beta-barrel porin domain